MGHFILYLFTGLFTIQSIRIIIIEITDSSRFPSKGAMWIFHSITAILWALCFVV